MNYETQKKARREPILQLSIFAENKVGRLNELIGILAANNVHIVGVCSIDTTDSSIIRIIVDYVDHACALLEENYFTYAKNEVVIAEITDESSIKKVTCALVEAEINIHYIYSMLMRPHGYSALVMHLEDEELAADILKQHQIKVLTQDDITR